MDYAFDWNRMRAFLATAEAGTLSGAARALGQTQPTVGRQIAALEQELGLVLFERVGRGLQLTDTGRDMLLHVRAMGAAADKVGLAAIRQNQKIEGEVRVTATDILSTIYLPKALARIRATAPRLRIDVVADNSIQDLMRREADIAIRHVRPQQPDLVSRLIGESPAHLYASPDYLAVRGHPKTHADFAAHDFISFGDPQETIDYLAQLNVPVTPENIHFGSANGLVMWEMAKAGLGICPMDQVVAKGSPQMVALLPKDISIRFPTWLTTHREIHTSPRIRLVFDILAEVLTEPS